MKRAAGLMVGISLGSSLVQAAPLSPQDFAFGLPVITNQEAAAYRFSLPRVPNEITFLAQGQGPFLLAYGNSTATRAEADLSQIPATVQIAAAAVGSRRVLGGSTRLVGKPAAFPWMRAVLWSVLLLAVVLLAWMAYRLANEPGR
jgi:hypothetical protein